MVAQLPRPKWPKSSIFDSSYLEFRSHSVYEEVPKCVYQVVGAVLYRFVSVALPGLGIVIVPECVYQVPASRVDDQLHRPQRGVQR